MPVINPTAPVGPAPSGSTAPCGWTIDTTCCPGWDTYTNAQRDRATAWATYILWGLTGRQFGLCEVTVRPCGASCNFPGGWMTYPVTADGVGTVWGPYIRGGQWFNCGCTGGCTCRPKCEVFLPGPVASVTEVLVDGLVVDPSLYRVDNASMLVGVDGQCWPKCQNMDLAGDVEGSFEVTYLRGTPLPLAGQIAAGELACEFIKACAGASCALPQNIASLTRQGIDVQLVDPTDVLTSGLTGVANVDLFIRTVNPSGLRSRPRVYSPDVSYPVQRTS